MLVHDGLGESAVRTVISLKALPGVAAMLAALAVPCLAQAAGMPSSTDVAREALQARFEPLAHRTQVVGRISPDLCFSLDLPEEWRLDATGVEPRLKAVLSNAELEVSLRAVHELRDLPQADLASRDAAVLQRDYEELLGRPAQSVSLSANAGATLWSATWVDANLPTASHAMTVETLILPLPGDGVLELSLSGVESQDADKALVQRMLAGLRVQGRASCQRQVP
jgi:hypothetical protein